MIVEIAVERYSFECAHCGHTWSADYDVQHLHDADDAVFAFYRLDGVPVPPPAEEDLLCPVCRHGRVLRTLVTRRQVPVASVGSTEPSREVITTPEERRTPPPAPV
ncbi:hypothetical protein [Lentzea sp. HUAS12]|uniref:hypothetical protein n=1 Tax=Lentzea sp. HUAS12 TaxID=2951806 RepID=UPI00209EE4F9|nr:hypothetical protein [Lentzea sp. HUAS12]USX53784.1 hypothetical protein ND450_06675 [Lentzea sp. HUAS12]